MPAATPALIERVEPYCAMDNTALDAARTSAESPGPSCPKTSTQARGKSKVSTGTDSGNRSTPSTGSPSPAAHSVNAATVSWWRTCR